MVMIIEKLMMIILEIILMQLIIMIKKMMIKIMISLMIMLIIINSKHFDLASLNLLSILFRRI